jgi:PAS domain S-box-containing protein
MPLRPPRAPALPPPSRAIGAFVVLMVVALGAALWVGTRLLQDHRDEALVAPTLVIALLLLSLALVGLAGLLLVRSAARAHEQLLVSEDRLRSLSDHSLDVIAIVGPDRVISYVNAAIERVLGRPREVYHGRDLLDWTHPDDQPVASAVLRQALDDPGRPYSIELRIAHADGSWRLLELRARAHLETPGIDGLIVNARDITHRKQTEQALHDRIRHAQLTRELSRALATTHGDIADALQECASILAAHFRAALVAFWTFEPEEERLVLRACAGRDWLCRDVPKRVAPGDGVIGRVASEQRPVLHLGDSRSAPGHEVGASHGEALPASIVGALTCPLLVEGRLAGVVRVLSFEAVSVQNVEALSTATSWIAAGIERVRAEAALRLSEEKFRQLTAAIDEVFWIYSLSSASMIYASSAYERIWGRPVEYALAGTAAWLDTIHPDDRDRVRAVWEARPVAEYEIEYRVVRADGDIRWILDRAYPVEDAHGVPFRLAGIAQDITDRKLAEQRIAIERAYFATLFNAAPIAIVVHDEAARVQLVNNEFERLFGYESSEIVGRDLNALIVPPEQRADGQELTATVAAGARVAHERRRIRKDGTAVDVALVGCPLEIPGGGSVIFAMYLDIGERRRAEQEQARLAEQLRHSQKMEAIGRLAGGVAHDFNNLLTVIVGQTQMLLEKADPTSEAWDELEEVRRATERASGLTRQLLAFSRRQILQPVPLDLNGVIVDMERMLRRLIRAEIAFTTHLASRLWTVRADPGQVQQVLLNLVVNARDAMPDGGRLTIETANRRLTAEQALELDDALAAGEYAVLTVRDSGLGMDAQTAARAFEPFYTTKEPGKGTGLGLATVYGIVRQSGGGVSVRSEPGSGTSIRIYLPRSRERPQPPAVTSDVLPRARRCARVLVAEDEDGVRRVILTVLRKEGFDVIEARDGAHALAAVAAAREPIDLLVTDVVMPGMSGRELAERLRGEMPDLPVLFVSGYTEDEVIRGGVSGSNTDFLEKPFRPAILLQRVAQLLVDGEDAVTAGKE